jgi:hypothetical protein
MFLSAHFRLLLLEDVAGADTQPFEGHRCRAYAGKASDEQAEAGKGSDPEESGVNPVRQCNTGQHNQPGKAKYGSIKRHFIVSFLARKIAFP